MPKTLAERARRFQLTANRPVKDLLSGLYVSAFKGTGIEFDEVRAYVPGDDVRTIDWRITARMKEPFVRRYVEERQLTLWLMVDCSASLEMGGDGNNKAALALEIATLLAFTAAYNHDRVGLILFTDRLEHIEPPRQGTRHVQRMLSVLSNFKPAGIQTDLAAVMEQLRSYFKKNQLVFLLSDFESPDFAQSLRRTAFAQSLHPVCIRHHLEASLPPVGLLKMRNAENGQMLLRDTLSASNRARFQQRAAQKHRELLDLFAANGTDCLDLQTGDDCVEALAVYLKLLERKGGNRRAHG
jgi:uncharacterized protein (DUF58 family)